MMDLGDNLMFSTDYPHWSYDSPTWAINRFPEDATGAHHARQRDGSVRIAVDVGAPRRTPARAAQRHASLNWVTMTPPKDESMTTETDRARPRGLGRIDPSLRAAAAGLEIAEFHAESLPAERRRADQLAADRAGTVEPGATSRSTT